MASRTSHTRSTADKWTIAGVIIGALALVVSGLVALYGDQLACRTFPDKSCQQGGRPAPEATPTDTGAVGGPASDPIPSAAAAPVAASGPSVVFDGEVELPRHAAVDVDLVAPTVRDVQVGATGDFDLYHDSGEVRSDNLQVHGGTDLVPYPAGETTAPKTSYEICKDYTGPSPSYRNPRTSMGIFPGVTGATFCFVTSARHVAWATVEGVDDVTQKAVVQVRVWDTVVENS